MTLFNRPVRLYRDLDFEFRPHPSTGDVAKKIDVNAVRQSLYSLLFTQPGERPFQPQLGTPLYGLLFEPADPITMEAVRRTIETTIQNFEPRVRLEDILITDQADENAYEITIFFTVIGLPNRASFTASITRLR
jgi:phage baseplate assembly protein W